MVSSWTLLFANPACKQKSIAKASRISELIHTDICYIGIPDISGKYTMFILFIDVATRYTTIYLLNAKSAAASAFIDYDKKSKISLAGTLLCSDRMGEQSSLIAQLVVTIKYTLYTTA